MAANWIKDYRILRGEYTQTQALEALQKAGKESQILHVIMHGKSNMSDPLSASLFLGDTDSITAGDVYQQEVPVDLLILDGCETGVGPYQASEGLQNLSRAFTQAGSSAILMSKWPVEAVVQQRLMESLLANLKSGMPKDLAWKKAQLAYLEAVPLDHMYPYYWAAMMPIGNMDPISTSSTKVVPRWGWLLLLGLVLAGGGVWMIRRQRRHS